MVQKMKKLISCQADQSTLSSVSIVPTDIHAVNAQI